MHSRILPIALIVALTATVSAQHPSEFTSRDKAEVFIQHLVKILRIEPAKFESMVLEYEIGMALAELAEHGDLPGDLTQDIASIDFIQNSLAELYPHYGRALEAFEKKNETELKVALKGLDTKSVGGKANPYMEAYLSLLKAEMDFRAGEFEKVVGRCEKLGADHRQRMIADYRVCELIAQSFEKLGRPLLEYAQYALLLTDYEELPKDLKARADARMAKLNKDYGKPLHAVAGWMRRVENLLSEEKTGDDPTQQKEKEILVALDKLIELQEAVERKSCKSCGGGECSGGQCKNGNPNGRNPKSPAEVSKLPGRSDGGLKLGSVSRARRDSIWGLLEEKDASRALKSFGGKLPPRYEKLLKKYYKRLSEED